MKIVNQYKKIIEFTHDLNSSDDFMTIIRLISGASNIVIFGIGNSSIAASDFYKKLKMIGFNIFYSSDVHLTFSVISKLNVISNYVNFNNKGKEITLMKKATANFENLLKPTTYDFKESILNTSDNLIELEPLNLPTRQSNIVSRGRAQVRYLLNNTNTTKVIPALTDGEKYTLAFYLITEGGTSSINVTILGKEYTINYIPDGGALKATVEGSPYKQTHNHDEVIGLYVNNIPILHNNRYYSYVKYTFEYTASGNLFISTSNIFEIAELTLKKGIIIPQSVQVYQDMLHGEIDSSLKPYMYNLGVEDIDTNILGKLYIPNTNYEIRGVLPYGL